MNSPEQSSITITVGIGQEEASGPEPEAEPVIEGNEDATSTSMPLEEYEELHPETNET